MNAKPTSASAITMVIITASFARSFLRRRFSAGEMFGSYWYGCESLFKPCLQIKSWGAVRGREYLADLEVDNLRVVNVQDG